MGATDGLITENVEMSIATNSRQRTNKTKTVACPICQKSFTRHRSTARFCSPRCRQRAHRRVVLSPVGEPRNTKAPSKRDVRPIRGPCRSGVGLCLSPKTELQQREPVSGTVTGSFIPRLMADQHWPGMWRIVFPDGSLSDMLNITRAKEALKRAQQFSRRSYR
jgi:hypothetical protein